MLRSELGEPATCFVSMKTFMLSVVLIGIMAIEVPGFIAEAIQVDHVVTPDGTLRVEDTAQLARKFLHSSSTGGTARLLSYAGVKPTGWTVELGRVLTIANNRTNLYEIDHRVMVEFDESASVNSAWATASETRRLGELSCAGCHGAMKIEKKSQFGVFEINHKAMNTASSNTWTVLETNIVVERVLPKPVSIESDGRRSAGPEGGDLSNAHGVQSGAPTGSTLPATKP